MARAEAGPRRRARRLGALAAPALFAALGVFAVSGQIWLRAEFWTDRALWLLAVAAAGGAAGALGARACLSLLRLPPRLPAAAAAAFLFAGFFMLGMGGAYVAQNLLVAGQFEPRPEAPLRAWLFTIPQVFVLFLVSAPAYLLPLPLPALMALAGWLLPPARAEEAVEPPRAGV